MAHPMVDMTAASMADLMAAMMVDLMVHSQDGSMADLKVF